MNKNDILQIVSDNTPLLIDTKHSHELEEEADSTRESQTEKGSTHCHIPKRFVLALLLFSGMIHLYSIRANMSVAILAMVNNSIGYSENQTTNECAALRENDTVISSKFRRDERYNWDAETAGLILSSFFYGYVITQIPGGYFSEHYSGKWLFGVSVLLTAFFNMLTPLAVGGGASVLIAVRFLVGLSQGGTKPSLTAIITRWTPRNERSRITAFVFTGGQLGTVIAMPVSGWLSSSEMFGGWPSVFYFFGTVCCIWLIFWIFFMHETPMDHPSISETELEYLLLNQEVLHMNPEVPWKAIFTSVPMWALIVGHFGYGLGFLTLLTVLPMYFKSALHFNIEENGILSALPYACQTIVAWITAFLADRLRQSGKMKITTIRKIFNSIGFIGSAVFLFAVTVSGCRPELIVTLVTLAMAVNGFAFSGFLVTHMDMSPDFAGTLFGITSAICDLNGIIGPAIAGSFTQKGATLENWNKMFYVLSAGYVITAITYALFASAELQPWGLDQKAIPIMSSKSIETIARRQSLENNAKFLKKVRFE